MGGSVGHRGSIRELIATDSLENDRQFEDVHGVIACHSFVKDSSSWMLGRRRQEYRMRQVWIEPLMVRTGT